MRRTSDRLANLVRIRELKEEPASDRELDGLKRSGMARLADAERDDLSLESRFDLAYNAAHALALYGLRRQGYRSNNRYLVFQVLSETAGLSAGQSKVLAKAHKRRNWPSTKATWTAMSSLLADMISSVHVLLAALGLENGA